MSQEDVELAQRASVALNNALKAGDLRPFLDQFCDPQIVFKPAGILPETAEMHGHDGMLQFGRVQAEAFEEFGVEPQDYIDAGDRVVVPLRFGGRARHTGLDVAFEVVYVATARDGKWTRVDTYLSKSEALKAVGLAE
jgi:ketosteroid isomerase-like protein